MKKPKSLSSQKDCAQFLGLVAAASQKHAPIDFIVIGHTLDDGALLAHRNVTITGPYDQHDVSARLLAADLDLGLILSTWPETYSYVLSEYWSAGVPVLAYDIGAPAERIRQFGNGILVPAFEEKETLLEYVQAALMKSD